MRKLFALLFAVFACACARAEDFALPASLERIEAQAFYASAIAGEVAVPNGVTAIGSEAFAHCAGLRKIALPASVVSIARDAFLGREGLVILCEAGSAAEAYAREMGIACETTTRRVYYVDLAGRDDAARDGSAGAPFRTLAYAASRATAPGDVIHVNAGTYVETERSYLAPGVNLEGEGSASVITTDRFSEESFLGIVNLISDEITGGDQSVSRLRFDGANLCAAQAVEVRNRSRVVISECEFEDFNFIAVGRRASGVGPEGAPAAYVTGGEFCGNYVHNCADEGGGWHRGALFCGGLDGFLIHDNVMIEDERAPGRQGWPIKFWYFSGWMKNCKIYDNHIEKTDTAVWPFAIESDHQTGLEICGNTIIGSIDLNNTYARGEGAYGARIHHNTLGPETPSGGFTAVFLEFASKNVTIENNVIRNANAALVFTPRTCDIEDVAFRDNDCGIVNAGWYAEAMRVSGAGRDPATGRFSSAPVWIRNLAITGNDFHANSGQVCWFGITVNWDTEAGYHWAGENINVSGNTFRGFSVNWLQFRGYDSLTGLRVRGNTVVNCGSPAAPVFHGFTSTDADIAAAP